MRESPTLPESQKKTLNKHGAFWGICRSRKLRFTKLRFTLAPRYSEELCSSVLSNTSRIRGLTRTTKVSFLVFDQAVTLLEASS